jgi:hypothetical protein
MLALLKLNSRFLIASATILRSSSVIIIIFLTGAGTVNGQPKPSTLVPDDVPAHLSNYSETPSPSESANNRCISACIFAIFSLFAAS